MTYQRNISYSLEQDLDQAGEHEVPQRQVEAGDEAEHDDHGGRLGHLAAGRPLYSAQLRPHLDEEVDEPVALAGLTPVGGTLFGAALGTRGALACPLGIFRRCL